MVGRKNAQGGLQSSLFIPVSGAPRYRIGDLRVPFGTCPRQSIDMNIASPLRWSNSSAKRLPQNSFHSTFQHAPVAAGRCDRDGIIVETNSACEQVLGPELLSQRRLRFSDLVPDAERSATERLFCDLVSGARDSIRVEGKNAGHASAVTSWTAWRQPGSVDESAQVFLIGLSGPENGPTHESLLQTQRWEAVGRLAGGVVHDFNNLLTGVMLYCDLLLSSLDPIDRRRRYADEIHSAIVQATGLVQQLLGFVRPKSGRLRPLRLNPVIEGMRNLLTRLIGANIALDFCLDSDLGPVRIDQTQAQQIILNLVLNARDALPRGGHIVVETSNCKFQAVAGSHLAQHGAGAFPCVLLTVSDNGQGMDAKTRARLFEPFFTTKGPGKGTGLGLTTVRSIVTTNRGLIHVESEPGLGTRVMILLPRASESADAVFLDAANSASDPSPLPLSSSPFQEVKKEQVL